LTTRATVLDVVPDPKGDLEQFITETLSVINAIFFASEFYPPVSHLPPAMASTPVWKLATGFEPMSPGWWLKGLRRVVFARLEKTRHAHRPGIGFGRRNGLSIFVASFSAHPVVSPGQGSKYGVPGTVSEDSREHMVVGLSRKLPTGNGTNRIAIHLSVQAGTV